MFTFGVASMGVRVTRIYNLQLTYNNVFTVRICPFSLKKRMACSVVFSIGTVWDGMYLGRHNSLWAPPGDTLTYYAINFPIEKVICWIQQQKKRCNVTVGCYNQTLQNVEPIGIVWGPDR